MVDRIRRFVEAAGLPEVRKRVTLRQLTPEGTSVAPHAALCLLGETAYVVRVTQANQGDAWELSDSMGLRYERGRFRDRFSEHGKVFETGLGDGKKARQILALSRIYRSPQTHFRALPRHRQMEPPTEEAEAWLQRFLFPEELLLAWLSTTSQARSPSIHAELYDAPGHFLMTNERSALVSLSDLGETQIRALPSAPLRLERLGQRACVRVGSEQWFVEGKSARLHEEIAHVNGLSQPERLRELVRLNFNPARASSSNPALRELEDSVELAEQMLEHHEPEWACALLESFADAPEDRIRFLDPPTAEESLQTRCYEVLARARGTALAPDASSLVKLVQLRPFERARAERLALFATEELKDRAVRIAALLLPGGVLSSAPSVLTRPAAPLETAAILSCIRHPLVGRSADMLRALQNLVAKLPTPDGAQLTDFCQGLSGEGFADAELALRDAELALGIPKLAAFVSRGDRAVGIRAFEAAPPFILLGGAHLEPENPCFLSPAELRFALGAELGHLRLGHARLTTSEFWSGALWKTGQSVELLLSFLPALKGWHVAHRLQATVAKLPPGVLNGLARRARESGRVLRARQPAGANLSPLNEELSGITRMFQLSADRAGLLVCRDPGAAVRSMLRIREDSLPLLARLEKESLTEVFALDGSDRRMRDFGLRIGALIAFYLSEQYAHACSPGITREYGCEKPGTRAGPD